MKRLFLSLFAVSLASAQAPPANPSWWSEGNPPVIVPGAAINNKGPANIGQAKYMAKRALETLSQISPTSASAIQADLVGPGKAIASFDIPVTPDEAWREAQRAPLLVGQLKAIAAPFYDNLHASAPSWLEAQRNLNGTNIVGTHLPWSQDAHEQNKSMATVGQLKAVFALRFETFAPVSADSDGDGLADAWEMARFGSLAAYGASDDVEPDGATNATELQLGLNPTKKDHPAVGLVSIAVKTL